MSVKFAHLIQENRSTVGQPETPAGAASRRERPSRPNNSEKSAMGHGGAIYLTNARQISAIVCEQRAMGSFPSQSQ
jgi:hypothetical protein